MRNGEKLTGAVKETRDRGASMKALNVSFVRAWTSVSAETREKTASEVNNLIILDLTFNFRHKEMRFLYFERSDECQYLYY
jgi:hypothetical protein